MCRSTPQSNRKQLFEFKNIDKHGHISCDNNTYTKIYFSQDWLINSFQIKELKAFDLSVQSSVALSSLFSLTRKSKLKVLQGGCLKTCLLVSFEMYDYIFSFNDRYIYTKYQWCSPEEDNYYTTTIILSVEVWRFSRCLWIKCSWKVVSVLGGVWKSHSIINRQ